MQQAQPSQTRSERRRAGRISCVGTNCQFGPVVDLSSAGARIIAKRPVSVPPSATVNLRLQCEEICMLIPARPMFCRKRPDGRFDVGFRFFFVSDAMGRHLVTLARAATDSLGLKARRSA